MRSALALLARWWHRRQLDTLLARYEALRWALERVDDPEEVDLLSRHFKITCDAIGRRGWTRALDAWMAEPRMDVEGEAYPCPVDPGAARRKAFAAAGLCLALLFALPAGAQEGRRWKVEEAISRPQVCYKVRLDRPPVCNPLISPSADPYRGIRASQGCAGISDIAARDSRWGAGFFHRGDAACAWANGHGPPPSAEEVIRELVGDPTYNPLCVEVLDVTVACNQGAVAAAAKRLGGSGGGSSVVPCAAIDWRPAPAPEWILNTGVEVKVGGWERQCCWREAQPPSPFGGTGIPAQFTAACRAAQPPPPPPPPVTCPDGVCSPEERASGSCLQDCFVEPPPSPSGCDALRLAIEEVCPR